MELMPLYQVIDQLSAEELAHLQSHIAERQRELEGGKPTSGEVEAKMAALDAAIAKFREGLSEEELQDIFTAMNAKYVNPKDLHVFDWVDDLPENER